MLRELSIKNFAIIDDLHIRFSEGLTVLSGETGAGKSIIINAVNLLLGSRATSSFIRTGAETAELEALFEIHPASDVARILADNDYNAGDELLIRRIISKNDRHRIYINGRLSTVKLQTEITQYLASISGQHAHQGLLQEELHLSILDQFGGLAALRENVGQDYRRIADVAQQLRRLIEKKNRQAEHLELLQFQKQEIIDAAISPDEDEALEKEITILKNAEALSQSVRESIDELYDAQDAVFPRLTEIAKKIDKSGEIDPELAPEAKKLDDIAFQLEDIIAELRQYAGKIETDDARLEEAENRLNHLNKLKRKYGGSLESVFFHLESVENQLADVENISGHIAESEAALAGLQATLTTSALELSEKRKQAAALLSDKVEQELASLKMPQTRFHIDFQTTPANPSGIGPNVNGLAVSETGIDKVVFQLSPNPGEALKPLSHIASGGELSRIVLALKVILAEKESVETVVFDEVDAGIGGGVAELVGKKLAALSKFHQIICITHLPQIAKFGDYHFKITKEIADGRTKTGIKPLDPAARIEEIARMLGGATITQATMDHAREMVEDAHP